jgi:hypothetical protein
MFRRGLWPLGAATLAIDSLSYFSRPIRYFLRRLSSRCSSFYHDGGETHLSSWSPRFAQHFPLKSQDTHVFILRQLVMKSAFHRLRSLVFVF